MRPSLAHPENGGFAFKNVRRTSLIYLLPMRKEFFFRAGRLIGLSVTFQNVYFGKSEIPLPFGPKSVLYPWPSPPAQKGRFAIVTNVGQGCDGRE
jgi:hypothetical protein